MNILVLQDHLRNGGTERQSILLARAFAEAGHPATLLTFRPGGALDFSPAPPRLRRAALQPFDTRLDWFAPGLRRAARRLAPDIVLCMGRMANCRAAALQRALPRAAVITTMRTGKELPRAHIRSLHASRHTIANSREAARILAARHALPAEKITVIHNAVVFPPGDTGCLPAKVEAASCRLDGEAAGAKGTGIPPVGSGGTGDPPVDGAPRRTIPARASSSSTPGSDINAPASRPLVLLCVAMFRPEKNHRALIELAARLPRPTRPAVGGANEKGIMHNEKDPEHADAGIHYSFSIPHYSLGEASDWELWLAGDGPERAPCEALAVRLGLAGRVRFLGFQSDPTPLYQAADIALLASTRESLPNFLVEAHAHGLPSVACAVGGVAECGGLAVPPGDADAFLAALLPLMRGPARRARESARVAAHAREHFSPAVQTAAYLRLFARLLERRAAP
jgi:glycosyltransferase involved in cell wall biosynthesis